MTAARTTGIRSPGSFLVVFSLAGAGPMRLADDRRDLTRLHQPFEVPQVVAHFATRRFAKERREPVAQLPGRWNVFHRDVHFRPPVPHGLGEADLADMVHFRTRHRTPRDSAVRLVAG